MRKSGEHHSKPYYKATDKSGAVKFLYWASTGFGPIFARNGYWYLSSSLGSQFAADIITKSKTSHGIRYCPQDYQSTPFEHGMSFRCDQQPPQPHDRQPRQCCGALELTTNLGNIIEMQDLGNERGGRQVYEGVTAGTSQVIYFEAASPGSSSGRWVMATSLKSIGLGGPPPFIIEGSKTVINGLDSCPTDQSMWSPTFGTLQCKQPPPPPPQNTCEDIVNTSFFTRSGDSFNRCSVELMVRNLVGKQIDRFIKFVRTEGIIANPDSMKVRFDTLAAAWQEMASGRTVGGAQVDTCGFKGDKHDKNPKIANCDDFCTNIKDLHEANPFSRKEMIDVLEEFLNLVDTQFDKGKFFKIF